MYKPYSIQFPSFPDIKSIIKDIPFERKLSTDQIIIQLNPQKIRGLHRFVQNQSSFTREQFQIRSQFQRRFEIGKFAS